jgi:aspartyl-tRNA(Asn)/glutamyl-tRNA(Gln) amidotransferase subunit A
VGLKPTYGRVSTRGVIPLSESLDHVGPMTRRVRDAALMLQPLASDLDDRGCANPPAPDYARALEATSGLRLGLPRVPFYDALHPDVDAAMRQALSVLESLGCRAHDVTLDSGSEASLPVLRAEVYATHESTVTSSPELYQAKGTDPRRQRSRPRPHGAGGWRRCDVRCVPSSNPWTCSSPPRRPCRRP